MGHYGDTLEAEFWAEVDAAKLTIIVCAMCGNDHDWRQYHTLLRNTLRGRYAD